MTAVRSPEIEFWFDFGSTYSYPAAINVEKLALAHDFVVKWRAFMLGAIFNEQGWTDSPFNIYPAKGRYMWRDLERLCRTQALDFNKPSVFPRNGLLASRITSAHEGSPWLGSFVRQIFSANFALDLDIADVDVVRSCLESLDLDPHPILSAAATAENKTKLREQTEHAKRLGIFGAPTFVVGDEIFWGNDRLSQAFAWSTNKN